jgi:hypothetical protein
MSSSTKKCSLCGISGHTKRSCKNKSINTQNVVSMWSEENLQTLEIHKSTLDLKSVESTISRLRSKHDDWIYEKQREHFHEYKKTNPQESFHDFQEKCRSDEKFCPKAKPWFRAQEETCSAIQTYLIENPDTHSIPATAECGSGKSNLMNALCFTLATKFDYEDIPSPEEYWRCPSQARNEKNTFVITGHSSCEYEEDLASASAILLPENIYHRNNIHKLALRLRNDPRLLQSSTFFVDEARLVVEEGMTLEKFFCENLNLDKKRIIDLNILIIYIDATPDTICLTCDYESDQSVSPMFAMSNSNNYRGVKYFMTHSHMKEYNNIKQEAIIVGYDVTTNCGKANLVNSCVSLENKNHILRLQGKSHDLINKLKAKGFTIEYDNSSTPIDLQSEMYKGQKRIFILTGKYRCAKRFRLGPNIGIIFEQPSKKPSDPVISQGLLARFFGYYTEQELALCDFRMITILEPFTRQLYFIENLQLPEGYKSSHIKNGKVVCRTYPEYLSEQRTSEERKMNKLITEGFECSGSVYKTILFEKHNKPFVTPPGCEFGERCEIYPSIEDFKNRCICLRNTEWNFSSDTTIQTYEYIRTLGSNTPTSNLPKTHEAFKNQIQANPQENNINIRAYKLNHNGVEKYAIRYIKKI